MATVWQATTPNIPTTKLSKFSKWLKSMRAKTSAQVFLEHTVPVEFFILSQPWRVCGVSEVTPKPKDPPIRWSQIEPWKRRAIWCLGVVMPAIGTLVGWGVSEWSTEKTKNSTTASGLKDVKVIVEGQGEQLQKLEETFDRRLTNIDQKLDRNHEKVMEYLLYRKHPLSASPTTLPSLTLDPTAITPVNVGANIR